MAKQQRIPGTETKQIAEINTAAEHYVEQRDKRIAMTDKEVQAKQSLIDAMKKHKVEIYRDDEASPPLVVQLTPGKDKVKVIEAGDDDEGAKEKKKAGGDEKKTKAAAH